MIESLIASTAGSWVLVFLLAVLGTFVTVAAWWVYEVIDVFIHKWWPS